MITLRVPQGAGEIQGVQTRGALKPILILCWETPFPVLNLGESQVCFVEGGSSPLPASQRARICPGALGISYTLLFVQGKRKDYNECLN